MRKAYFSSCWAHYLERDPCIEFHFGPTIPTVFFGTFAYFQSVEWPSLLSLGGTFRGSKLNRYPLHWSSQMESGPGFFFAPTPFPGFRLDLIIRTKECLPSFTRTSTIKYAFSKYFFLYFEMGGNLKAEKCLKYHRKVSSSKKVFMLTRSINVAFNWPFLPKFALASF